MEKESQDHRQMKMSCFTLIIVETFGMLEEEKGSERGKKNDKS